MILVAVGTRPELLKMAPVVKLAKARGLPIHVHCTMQSPDLVDREILPWDTEGPLDLIVPGLRESATKYSTPDLVAVQGDTRTAFQAALLAFECGVPVFHLEAGVRTGDLAAPFPEEGYRRMISQVATYHACTTELCAINLKDDLIGVLGKDVPIGRLRYVRVTGSPIVESVRARVAASPERESIQPYILLTLHRRENRGHFADILRGVSDAGKGRAVLWPTHPNSWAENELPRDLPNNPMIVAADPFDPTHFADILQHTTVVVTDSGGVQEEANVLGVPCVVARTVTDRPESLGLGGAILGGNTRKSIAHAIRNALSIDRQDIDPTIFGDGKASERICDWWQSILSGDIQ